jgi:hypothetical protein
MQAALHGKTVEIRLSKAAEAALAQRSSPLLVEMELLFSCLLRKRVHFLEQAGESVAVTDKLSLRLHTLMTRHCAASSVHGETPSDDFPIQNVQAFVPHWLNIDFRKGQWLGEFGY